MFRRKNLPSLLFTSLFILAVGAIAWLSLSPIKKSQNASADPLIRKTAVENPWQKKIKTAQWDEIARSWNNWNDTQSVAEIELVLEQFLRFLDTEYASPETTHALFKLCIDHIRSSAKMRRAEVLNHRVLSKLSLNLEDQKELQSRFAKIYKNTDYPKTLLTVSYPWQTIPASAFKYLQKMAKSPHSDQIRESIYFYSLMKDGEQKKVIAETFSKSFNKMKKTDKLPVYSALKGLDWLPAKERKHLQVYARSAGLASE